MFEKPVGVTIPQGQLSPGVTRPKQLLNIYKLSQYAVQFSDDNGTIHNTIIAVGNNVVYVEPNGERWAATVKIASPWLTELVLRQLASMSAEIPKQDAVDVIANKIHEELSAQR